MVRQEMKVAVTSELVAILANARNMFFFKMVLLSILIMFYGHAFADTGGDILQGTTASAEATVKGSLMTYFYIGELIVAIVGYIVSRKPTVFLGLVILSLFVNVAFSVFIK